MTKYKKRRRRALPVVIISLVVAVALAVWGFFGYKIVLKYTHPIKYENYVEHYSRDNGLDKYLVYAVIKTESRFDPGAVSNVGARGLMQIMEETFDWIKYRLGDEETVYDDMFEPEENIRYGAYLIDYLVDYFGDTDAAVAAYHSGIGAVSEWLTDSNCSQDGKTLYNIPSSTAAHYVNKINKALATYTELYGQERKY